MGGSVCQGNRLLLSVGLSASGEVDDEFDDLRSNCFGAPIFNVVPPLRGPKVMATTLECLAEPTATRLGGEVTVGADPYLGWAPLLQPTISGYFERSRGVTVLRHGRVAARFAFRRAVVSSDMWPPG